MKRVNTLAAGIFLLGQTIAGAAFAAPVTVAGLTVDFSFDDALLGLFGQPVVTGDSLYFTPTTFSAEALNGVGFDLTKQTLNIKVTTHDGFDFSSLALSERGDYLQVGAGAKVAVSGQIRVFDSMNPANEVTASILSTLPFLPTDDFVSKDWTAGAATSLSEMKSASMINVTLENILIAQSPKGSDSDTPTLLENILVAQQSPEGSDTLAFIEKKFAGLNVVTAPVPEADTYAMMLAGLGLVGWSAMRRRNRLS